MSVSIAPYPRFKAFYPATGSPLSGGQLYTVQPGTTVQFGIPPAYPLATYTDSTGLTQNNNPVTLDSNGEADVWLSGYTKFVLFDANGNLVWTKDNVSSSPALQSISLQWVPQSTQVTFYSPTQFIVPGNQTAIFLPGTAVLATMTGATAIGIVQSASTGGTPVVTTVTVAWFSTQLNNSVSAVATGIVPGGVPGSMPVMPTVPVSANMTANATNLFQVFVANSANAVSFTLPAANSVPSGAFYDVFNAGSANATVVGTINGAANLTLTAFTGARIISDGANWWSTPGAGPTSPTVPKSANYTLLFSDLYHQFVANAANLTLPAANSVPDGAWYDVFNTGASNATVIGTVNGSANLAVAQYVGKRIFSASGAWYAK